MKSKEPGAIRQLFMFVGSSKGKMKFSIFMAVLGELFGMVPSLCWLCWQIHSIPEQLLLKIR